MRKRLDTVHVLHPQTGEELRVLPMDDGHFDIEIDAGRVWAVFNLRSGVTHGTRIGLLTVNEGAPHAGPLHADEEERDVYDLDEGVAQAMIQEAFADAGMDVRIELRTTALTASIDGGLAVAAVLVVPTLKRLGELFADDAYAYLRRMLHRMRWRDEAVEIRAREDAVAAVIELDLPPEAFLRLQGALPDAPSGMIVFNRTTARWQDSDDER